MTDSPTRFSPMQLLKRSLYAMRNGIVADSLRRAGCPRRLIFGVNLPQLSEIARQFGPSAELADALWRDDSLRESILLAPMLYPRETLTPEKARLAADAVRWSEDADILCFKLLQFAPFAPELAAEFCDSDQRLRRYTGLRLWLSLAPRYPREAAAAAAAELLHPEPLAAIAARIADAAADVTNE